MIRPRTVTLVLALTLPLLGGCPEGARQEQWTPELDAARAGVHPESTPPAAPPSGATGATRPDGAPALSAGAVDVGTALPLGRLGDGLELPRNQPASLRLAVSKVTGGLKKDVIDRMLRRSQSRFRLCQERAGASDPYIQAIATFSLTIAKDGKVKADATTLTDLGEAGEAEDCLKKAFAATEFPAPEGGPVKVQGALAFAPGEADGVIHGKPLREATAADVEQALKDAGYTDVVATPKGTRGLQLFTAKKGDDTVSLVFVPWDADHPVTEGLEWDAVQESTVVHGFDGARFFLGAKAKDRAATKALLKAIIQPAEQ